jgi:hypothetical protein
MPKFFPKIVSSPLTTEKTQTMNGHEKGSQQTSAKDNTQEWDRWEKKLMR